MHNSMIDEQGTVKINAPQDAYNLLTGEYDLARDRVGMRPFAFDVNNFLGGWPCAGLSQADLIVEYDAGGGIPRLMAMYSDIRDLPRVGTIRSLRMSGVIPVFQMDPIVVCVGTNIKVDDFVYGQAAFRIFDGNNTPQIIYQDEQRYQSGYEWADSWFTSGRLIYNMLRDVSFIKPEHKGEPLEPFFSFLPPDGAVTPADGHAGSVKVDFSYYAQLRYDYDTESGLWMRSEYDQPQIDSNTGEQIGFDNVLLLFGEQEILEEEGFIPCMQFEKGGEGLWLSRGGYQLIRWSKDGPTGAFLLFDQEGNPLSINAGTSCISLIDQIQRDTLVIS